MVVPDGDPGESVVGEEEVFVGAVGGEAAAVVVQGEDLALGLDRSWVAAGLVLVDVVAELSVSIRVAMFSHSLNSRGQHSRCYLCVQHCRKH